MDITLEKILKEDFGLALDGKNFKERKGEVSEMRRHFQVKIRKTLKLSWHPLVYRQVFDAVLITASTPQRGW